MKKMQMILVAIFVIFTFSTTTWSAESQPSQQAPAIKKMPAPNVSKKRKSKQEQVKKVNISNLKITCYNQRTSERNKYLCKNKGKITIPKGTKVAYEVEARLINNPNQKKAIKGVCMIGFAMKENQYYKCRVFPLYYLVRSKSYEIIE